jgi:DNA-binding MarR family transcriptional regulator
MIPRRDEHRGAEHSPPISEAAFRQLVAFRHCIRQFLHFSEEVVRAHGLEPQQYQILLALRGLPQGARPTITTLAEQLCLRHNSIVELVDRLVEHGALNRRHGAQDHREVPIELTSHGETLLERLAGLQQHELRVSGPALCKSLRSVMDGKRLV